MTLNQPLDGKSMPLNLGQENRFYTRYQRIAMDLRGHHCVAEDCDRPPAWCDAHHDGYTTTKLPNGKVRYRSRQ